METIHFLQQHPYDSHENFQTFEQVGYHWEYCNIHEVQLVDMPTAVRTVVMTQTVELVEIPRKVELGLTV